MQLWMPVLESPQYNFNLLTLKEVKTSSFVKSRLNINFCSLTFHRQHESKVKPFTIQAFIHVSDLDDEHMAVQFSLDQHVTLYYIKSTIIG